MVIFGIIVALLMFTIIVVIHELWHFWAARKFWVKVYEFWVGLPPKAKKLFTDKKWTDFTLNYLPFWGYVKLAWENLSFFKIYDEEWNRLEDEQIEEALNEWKPIFDSEWNEIPVNNVNEIRKALDENKASYSLVNKAYWKQMIIILGWVFMNFLLAIAIFSVLFFIWVKPLWINSQIPTERKVLMIPTVEQAVSNWLILIDWVILNPVEGSRSEAAWIMPWDKLISATGKEISDFNSFTEVLQKNKENEITFIVERAWENVELQITPDSEGKIWSYVWDNAKLNENFEYKFWALESLKMWALETYNQSMLTLESLWYLLWNIFKPETPEDRQEALESVAGPIWIIWVISQTFSEWIVFLLIIWAIISVNLWVFNLLPIPALDGWRFFFIMINSISEKILKRKAITPKIESFIHVWFFMLLIALSLLIAFKDIKNLFL